MKEDAQLTCPICYEDPYNHWEKIERILVERLPIRDVTWKSPISSSYITVSKLPLRFQHSSANLFKDTDHSYRWFLSPYVKLYIISAETLDSYKVVRTELKKWLDIQNTIKGPLGKCPWLIIYLPLGNYSLESYQKIYSKISNEFYYEKSGDRSVMLLLAQQEEFSTRIPFVNPQQVQNSLVELFNKLRDGIVISFQVRSALYDAEIKRLDSTKGTQNFDFRHIFLVKESLALLYQMMQLPDMALIQYEELETLLSYAQDAQLPKNGYPFSAPEPLKPASDAPIQSTEADMSSNLTPSALKEKHIFSDLVKNAEDIVSYSINLSRMKVLRNKLSFLELKRYIFARKMYFFVTLQRPTKCAYESLDFLRFVTSFIERNTEENIQDSFADNSNVLGSQFKDITKVQISLWCLIGAIKLCRVCRDLMSKILSFETNSDSLDASYSLASILSTGKNSKQILTNGSSAIDILTEQVLRGSGTFGDNKMMIREVHLILCDLIQFAKSNFQLLSSNQKYTKSYAYYLITQHDYHRFDSSLSSTEENLTPNENLKTLEAKEYFSIFEDESARISLEKELETLNINSDINIDAVLTSLSSKLKSVSNYWAKINGDNGFMSPIQSSSITPLSPLRSSSVRRSHIEKGTIIETLIAILLHKVHSDIYSLCDRNHFSNQSKIHLIQTLLSSNQHHVSISFVDTIFHKISSTSVPEEENKNIFSTMSTWKDLKVYILKSLLVSAKRIQNVEYFRKALSWLVLSFLEHSEKPVKTSIQSSVLSLWIQEIISLSKKNPQIDPIILPADRFFQFRLLKDLNVEKLKAYECINDELFPVSLRILPSTHNPQNLSIQIFSSLKESFEFTRFSIIFRKIHKDTFHQNFDYHLMNGLDSSLHENPTSAMLSHISSDCDNIPIQDIYKQCFEAGINEFSCKAISNPENRIIYPGWQTLEFDFMPFSLGEFGIDRISLEVGSLLFFHKILHPEKDSYALPSLTPISQSLYEIAPLTHEKIQSYFDSFELLKIQESGDSLTIDQIEIAEISPPNQIDYLIFRLFCNPTDDLQTLSFNVNSIESFGKISKKLRTRIISPPNSKLSFANSTVSSLILSKITNSESQSRKNSTSIPYDFVSGIETLRSSFDANSPTGPPSHKDFHIEINLNSQNCLGDEISTQKSEDALAIQIISETEGSYLFKVPFIPHPLGGDIMEDDAYVAAFQSNLTGNIKRGETLIPFKFEISSNILCGYLLAGESYAEWNIQSDPNISSLMVQIKIKNTSSGSLKLLGYEVIYHDPKFAFDHEIVSFSDQLPLVHSLNGNLERDESIPPILLEPASEYFFAFNLKIKDPSLLEQSIFKVYYSREAESSFKTALDDHFLSHDIPIYISGQIPHPTQNILSNISETISSNEYSNEETNDEYGSNSLVKLVPLLRLICFTGVLCETQKTSSSLTPFQFSVHQVFYDIEAGLKIDVLPNLFDSIQYKNQIYKVSLVDTAQWLAHGIRIISFETVQEDPSLVNLANNIKGNFLYLVQMFVLPTSLGSAFLPSLKIEEHVNSNMSKVLQPSQFSQIKELEIVDSNILQDLQLSQEGLLPPISWKTIENQFITIKETPIF